MTMVSPRDLVAVARRNSAASKIIRAFHLFTGRLASKENLVGIPASVLKSAVEPDGRRGVSQDLGGLNYTYGGRFLREPRDEFGVTPVGGRRKRLADIVMASAFSVLVAPAILAIALCIKLSMGGPVIYRHRRVGFAGRPFDCFKFRTMVANGDEVLKRYLAANPSAAEEWRLTRKLTKDPRVTRLGWLLRKTSLDELPQLINILRGELSCVGPRPIVTDELELYGSNAYEYLRARPGITGSWQVSGRSNVSYDYRVRLDAEYVRKWSFRSDVRILARTVPAVFKVDQAA